MRLLIATDAWRPQVNGVVRTLEETMARLPGLGVDVGLVTPDDFPNAPMPGYPEIRLALATSRALMKRIESFRPDAVHVATEGPVGLAARSAALRAGLPLTTSYHTRFPEYVSARAPVPQAVTYAALRRFHNAARGVFVATQTLEDELRRRGFRSLMRWSRGVDLSLFRPRGEDRRRWPRPVFLNVGRVAVEKNLEAFLTLDLPGTKVVVGDGPQRAALAARFPEAVFTGALAGEALADAYAQADVFVFPSRTDTFGVVLLEALASGLPVAAHPVMGPLDILDGTRAGILSEDLREAALACLALDRRHCADLAHSYSWDRSALQFVANLDQAARRCARRGRGERPHLSLQRFHL